jgi:cellulose synthase/poly-beta-1,6-N-acetylglucosamine synthase-like glycosyltransferase
MLLALLLVAGGVFLLAAAHPFTLYPISLKLLAFVYKKPLKLTPCSTVGKDYHVALCLCAYNEEQVIRAKVENMLAARRYFPDLEILVYVDAASDRTSEILAEFKDRIDVFMSTSRSGKTHGMNLLVQSTSADIIIFTDANVIFEEDALVHLLRPFGDLNVGCALGHLRYVKAASTATASVGSYYWLMEEQIKGLETLTGSAITSDGSLFAIRRILHHLPPPEVSDDAYVSLSILCSGYRVVRVAEAIAYEEVVSSAAEEFDRKVRIACLAFTVHRMLWSRLQRLPAVDLYKYISHKLLRWLTIYLLTLAALFLIAGLLIAEGWVAAAFAFGFGALVLRGIWISRTGLLAQVGSVLQAFVATGIGVWRSIRGAHFQTWNPPASTREQIDLTKRRAAFGRSSS